MTPMAAVVSYAMAAVVSYVSYVHVDLAAVLAVALAAAAEEAVGLAQRPLGVLGGAHGAAQRRQRAAVVVAEPVAVGLRRK